MPQQPRNTMRFGHGAEHDVDGAELGWAPTNAVTAPAELMAAMSGVVGHVQIYRLVPDQHFTAGGYEITAHFRDGVWAAGADQEELHLTVE